MAAEKQGVHKTETNTVERPWNQDFSVETKIQQVTVGEASWGK